MKSEYSGCAKTPGDANNDGMCNIGDAVFLINLIFGDGYMPACRADGDSNADCVVNIGDAVYLISHIFKEGEPPLVNHECTWP